MSRSANLVAYRRSARLLASVLPLEPRLLLSGVTDASDLDDFRAAPTSVVRVDGTRYKGFSDGDGMRILVPVAPKLKSPTADGTFTRLQVRSDASLTSLTNLASLSSLSDPGFNITLNLTGAGLTDTIRTAFTAAKTRWEQIITADVPDVGTTDDIRIDASIVPIDGVGRILGQAGPRTLRSSSFIPDSGIMQFDSADLTNLANSGSLSDVIFHEMGHVLGIGTIWSYKSLTTGVGTTDPRYTGANAVAAYQALGGTDATIPLENTGGSGTAGAHWRESIFNNEIMTGYLNAGVNPASTISIASLIDLGYTVDLNQADAYLIPGLTPPGGIPPSINGSISGILYNDANNSGSRDDGEAPIAGKLVFLDTNNNARPDVGERFTTTASDGSYAFGTLRAGTYNLRTVLPAGSIQTATVSVTLEAGDAATAVNLGTFDTISAISGTAFVDTNNNGTRDTGELAAASRIVFIDANDNGLLDRGESSTRTAVNGTYAFRVLSAGTYRLRLVLSSGVVLTTSSPITLSLGQKLTDVNLGAFDTNTTVSGTVYADANNNGTRDTGELPLAGRVVFLDTNNDGIRQITERVTVTSASGVYTFVTLPPSDYAVKVVTSVRVSQTTPVSLSLNPAEVVSNVDLGLYDANATLRGTLFLDANNNATRDSGELPVARGVVFLDTDNDSVLDSGEPFALTSSTGAYTLATLAAGTYNLRAVAPSAIFSVTAGGEVTLAEAQTLADANVGLFNITATVSGTVYADTNNNGTRDTGELPFARTVVFADANNNGLFERTERATSTGADGSFILPGILPGDYNIRAVFPTGTVHSADTAVTLTEGQRVTAHNLPGFDTTVAISGTVYNDFNNNAARDTGETVLPATLVYLDTNNNAAFDLGERTSVTSAAGAYSFAGLVVGTYNVRLGLPAGSTATESPSALTLEQGVKSAGNNFGVFNSTGTIAGIVYFDANRNGTKETAEVVFPSFTVYLDANSNGALDPSERTALTSRTGSYAFLRVPQGSYTVRPFLASGLVQSQPSPQSVTLAPYQTLLANPIGISRALAVRASLNTSLLSPSPSTLAPALSPSRDLFSSTDITA